ncbi:MAG: hypothetical protein ACJ75P_07900 [Gaiellaceae bacterium]
MRSTLLGLTLAMALGPMAAAAHGDGLPVPVDDAGGEGITAANGAATEGVRYVALRGNGHSVVARVQRAGGRALGWTFLPGAFTIPAVALDGSPAGLSADGRTLVLIRPRVSFPQRSTRLAILDARRLRVRRIVTLRGDFSFDAISPNGRHVYLIQYVAPKDPTRYAVRSYDVARSRLSPGQIVDPRERDEAMRGFPLTRTTSADGRWAYTLYDGAGDHPFIHALDTRGRTARCIDLDSLTVRDLGTPGLHLDRAGSRLVLDDGKTPLALVETKTFAVSEPGPAPATDLTGTGRSDDAFAKPLLGAAGIAVLLAAGGVSLRARRRRRPVTT